MDIQKLMDAISHTSRTTREDYHLLLGEAIERLGEFPADAKVRFDFADLAPCDPHSYRGYYSDLAFEGNATATVADFLQTCSAALGQTFEGYKGGDFFMGENTPLWAASYSNTGSAIIDMKMDGGAVVLITKRLK